MRGVAGRRALRDAVFWLLAASFVAPSCAVAAISVLLVTMLHGLGHSPGFAATVTRLLGATGLIISGLARPALRSQEQVV